MKQRVRQIDIAQAVGVSQRVVSSVLGNNPGRTFKASPAMREKILQTAREMGYTINQSASELRGGSSKIVGVLINNYFTQESQDLLFRLGEAAHGRGYHLLIGQVMDTLDDFTNYFNEFASRSVEAVICLQHQPLIGGSYPSIEKCIHPNLKVVYLGQPAFQTETALSVSVDHRTAYTQAVEYLHRHGARRIGFLSPNNQHPHIQDRLAGYLDGLRRCNLEPEAALQLEFSRGNVPLDEEELSRVIHAALKAWIPGVQPDAILATNDILASEILRFALLHNYAVPNDFQVIGFGNLLPLALRMHPQLSSFQVQNGRMAEALFKLALETETVCRRLVIPPVFVPRGSTRN